MIDHVLNGYGTPAYSVCDGLPWYNPASEVAYDPEGAAALLDEAGWLLGDDGYRYKDGVRAELNLLYSTGDSVRQALCADFANQMEELGIACTLEGVGWDTAYDRALSQPLIWGWGAHTPMELYNLYHTIGDTGSAQYSPYSNPTVDAYMDAGPGQHRSGGVLSALAAGPVGRRHRRHPGGRRPLGVAGERRPPLLGAGRAPDRGAENPSPRARVVHRQQCGPVGLVLILHAGSFAPGFAEQVIVGLLSAGRPVSGPYEKEGPASRSAVGAGVLTHPPEISGKAPIKL